MKITAIYPGTFDPITHGHVDIISRAARIFDKVFLAIADSTSKQTLFSTDERMDLAKIALSSLENVEVCHFDKLVTDVARDLNAKVIVRGIRAAADREVTVIQAEAYRDSESTRGAGDALAASIYADAFNRDPEFYGFTRSLRAYRESFQSKGDLMLIEPDSDFFRYLKDAKGGK